MTAPPCICGCSVDDHCHDEECCNFTTYELPDQIVGGGHCARCMKCSMYAPRAEPAPTCSECNDTQEVTRYEGGSYDHPPRAVKVPCPKCLRPSSTYRDGLQRPQPPFPQTPDKNRN